jgi:hypothetical protein
VHGFLAGALHARATLATYIGWTNCKFGKTVQLFVGPIYKSGQTNFSC